MNQSPTAQASVSIKVSPAVIGCLVLVVSFFLPWIRFWAGTVAGYEIGKLSSDWQWLWTIPVVAVVALLLGLTGKRHIEIAQIAGGLPLVGFGIAVYHDGAQLFQALLPGAWCTLLSGLFLVSIAPRLGRTVAAQPAVSPVANQTSSDNQ